MLRLNYIKYYLFKIFIQSHKNIQKIEIKNIVKNTKKLNIQNMCFINYSLGRIEFSLMFETLFSFYEGGD